MEKQMNQFLTELLENDTTKLEDSFLDKYYELFDTKKYLGKDFDSIYKDMEQKYSIKKYSIPYDDNSTEIYKQLVLSVVNISDNKKRLKLIPLIVYLDIENILYNYLHKNNYFDSFIEINDFFIGTFKDSYVSTAIKNISRHHWESEAYENYKKGLENKDFNKIYNFVEAVQRRNFMYEPFIDFLSFVSAKMFFDDFVNLLDSEDDVFKIKYLLNNLTIKEKFLLADKSNNEFVKFEAIRDSVYFQSNHNSCSNLLKDENELLSSIMISLTQGKQIWKDCLQYFLVYPSRNPQLFLPLADVLNKSSDEIIDIFIDTIKINQYFNEDSKDALNNSILKIYDDNIQKYIMEKIFLRWYGFIDSYEDYIGSLLLTDVIDIVIVYIREFVSKEAIEIEINQFIYDIEEIDNKWFKSSSEQSNYLYKQLTKLFIYGFSLEKHNLNEMKERLKCILQNLEAQLKNDYTQNTKSSMQLFKEHII